MSIHKAVPTTKEIKLDPKKMIVSKTDTKGIIIYGNDYFSEISGYKESELISSPHNILRHPDMPRTIFHTMWRHLNNGRNITAIVKNLTKNGSYYWVTTDFEIKRDNTGAIKYFIAYRQSAPKNVVTEIEKLYKKLLMVEKEHGLKAGIAYLEAFLEEKKMNYDQYIEDLAKPRGFSSILFDKMKQLFQ